MAIKKIKKSINLQKVDIFKTRRKLVPKPDVCQRFTPTP